MPATDRTLRDLRDDRLLTDHARRRDAAGLERLVRRFRPLSRSVAREYHGRGETFEDLVQVADLGLVQAIGRWDPGRGSRFPSFAMPTIRGEVRRHLRDRCWAVHVPRPLRELDERARRTRTELERGGRRVDDAALAAELDVSRRELDEARTASGAFAADALDSPSGEERHDAGPATDPGYERVEARDLLRRELRGMRERERLIVRRRLEGRKQREIGAELGISQVQVSRVLAEIHRRLLDAGAGLGAAVDSAG